MALNSAVDHTNDTENSWHRNIHSACNYWFHYTARCDCRQRNHRLMQSMRLSSSTSNESQQMIAFSNVCKYRERLTLIHCITHFSHFTYMPMSRAHKHQIISDHSNAEKNFIDKNIRCGVTTFNSIRFVCVCVSLFMTCDVIEYWSVEYIQPNAEGVSCAVARSTHGWRILCKFCVKTKNANECHSNDNTQ